MRVGPRASLGILEKRKISCLWQDTNPWPFSPKPRYCSGFHAWAVPSAIELWAHVHCVWCHISCWCDTCYWCHWLLWLLMLLHFIISVFWVCRTANREQCRVVTGLLTGHNTLCRHLHLMGLKDSPLFRKCGAED
jgi:hypothetical protein